MCESRGDAVSSGGEGAGASISGHSSNTTQFLVNFSDSDLFLVRIELEGVFLTLHGNWLALAVLGKVDHTLRTLGLKYNDTR